MVKPYKVESITKESAFYNILKVFRKISQVRSRHIHILNGV